MFLIYGIAFFVVAAVLTAAAGMLFQGKTADRATRGIIGSQAFGVLLAAIMGIGAVLLIAFLTEFESQVNVLLQVAVAVGLVAVGFVGVRFFARRTPVASAGPSRVPHGGLHGHAA